MAFQGHRTYYGMCHTHTLINTINISLWGKISKITVEHHCFQVTKRAKKNITDTTRNLRSQNGMVQVVVQPAL